LNIDNKISALLVWRYTLQTLVTFVDAVNVKNNNMVFSANDRVFIKLLSQEKGYGAKKIIA